MQKIKSMATIAFVVLLPYLVYYPYEALNWQLNMAFLDPSEWQEHRWAHSDVEIAAMTRAVFFAIWCSAVIWGTAGLLWACRVIWLFWRGAVFDLRVAKAILWLGRCIVAGNVTHIAAACVSPMIVSWHNPEGPLPLRFWYSSTHLGLILCGLAFVLMGAVMREAIRIARENEEFV